MTSFQNDLGFEVIVPTSRLTQSDKMARGIAQVSFNPNNNDELKEKALASLRAVRDYLLTPRLGNGGHFGLGCYAEQKIGLFHNFAQLWIRASYDIFLQNEEGRSFIFRPTQTAADMALLLIGTSAGAVLGGTIFMLNARSGSSGFIMQVSTCVIW
ncbi:hypothetical protein EBZ39_07870 [bacterium]|nr:hypothetical protein [bacterium]